MLRGFAAMLRLPLEVILLTEYLKTYLQKVQSAQTTKKTTYVSFPHTFLYARVIYKFCMIRTFRKCRTYISFVLYARFLRFVCTVCMFFTFSYSLYVFALFMFTVCTFFTFTYDFYVSVRFVAAFCMYTFT